jgi:1-acyl-sn-glycerol-3-phosphate acyltransferase
MRILFTWIFKLLGWSVSGSMPNLKKYVIAVAPHTSGWDFIIGVLARSALRIEHARYLGKSQLFRPPLGWIFRWLGGTPVDRSGSHDVVDQVVKIFNAHDEFVLALAPEGTRQKVGKLRTGFYYIAKKAGVAIVPVGFDFEKKKIVIGEPLFPSDNFDKDMESLLSFYRPIKGKIPELGLQ